MGNRFRALEEYHSLITAHGVFAAVTFLGVVPTAIIVAKFYHPDPRLALRIHISLQILTVILATVILLLGYFAVGPSRSLSNPHHGIGVAIHVLVLVQAIGGAIIHRIEKGKMRYYIPIKLMVRSPKVQPSHCGLMRFPASSMDGEGNRTVGTCTDTHRPHSLRLPSFPVRPLHVGRSVPGSFVLRTHLQATQADRSWL